MGEKKFLEVKSLFFVMHFECIFVKIKAVFVAESYTTVSQNIQIYFAALQLNAKFDAAAISERMLASTGKRIVGHSCCRPIVIISCNYHLR